MPEPSTWVRLPLPWRPQTSGYTSRIRAAILDWEVHHGFTWLLRTVTLIPFFRVCHTDRTYRVFSGVRPGDPLADLIFNAGMTGFIMELHKCLIADGLLVRMQDLDGSPLEQARTRGLSWIWMAHVGRRPRHFHPQRCGPHHAHHHGHSGDGCGTAWALPYHQEK